MPSPKRIGKIEFGLLSPKEIREMSVRKIIWADTYDDDGFPYPQGLMDLNLGVIDPGLDARHATRKQVTARGISAISNLQNPLSMSVIHVLSENCSVLPVDRVAGFCCLRMKLKR